MIGLNVRFSGDEVLVRLDGFPRRLRDVLDLKFRELVDELRLKVMENLSGKVLNTKSGALLGAVRSGVEQLGSQLIGFVEIDPANTTVKEYALVHEYGGKGSYEIVPVSKRMLRFIGKSGDVVFASYVLHPPAAERSYLRSAFIEMQPLITSGLEDALFDAIYGAP